MANTTASDPWIDALQTILADVEEGHLPEAVESALLPGPHAGMHAGMTEQQVRDGVLDNVRAAVGKYALMLRDWRWARQHRGWELILPRSQREMIEALVGPSHDPELARPIARAIVGRISELVGTI